MTMGSEYTEVERPLLDQLAALGWQVIEASKVDPATSDRSSFREVLLEKRARSALQSINRGPGGAPWLDDSRLSEVTSELLKPGVGKLIEINERVTAAVLEGVTVSGLPGWDQGRDQRIQLIDFDNPSSNDFLAISQFRVDEPGGQGKKYIAPDIVLFVNGIPLVVIECKSPYVTDPMAEGIKQLRRYANRRGTGIPEGNEKLFWSNQFVVSTYGDRARVGTFTSNPDHFLEWRDPAPKPLPELAAEIGKRPDQLTGQELLVAGMLEPTNLLDIVRHFTLFAEEGGKRFKLVARYPQFRAVHKALDRMRTGMTRLEHGEHDFRGGVIWHTQGSGKSLTMVFLVRAMRTDPILRAFKVVIVTDRTDLEKQLSATAKLSGEVVRRARKASRLRKLLTVRGPALVFAMIQKYRDPDAKPALSDDIVENGKAPTFGVLNADDTIVILVDEAHRSQTSTLHANLMAALPNAAKIGFTGTPIMKEGKKKTASIFGTEIDRYTIRDAESDGAVVPILYEGKTAKGAVAGASDLDVLFEDMFIDHTDAELEALKSRYATTGSVLEAPAMIATKARSMFWHYVAGVLPAGFKAQVASASRLAAVRYRDALVAARDDFVTQVEALDADLVGDFNKGAVEVDGLDRKTQILLRSLSHLELIRALEFVPVISEGNNDPADWANWTDNTKQDLAISEFKKTLGAKGKKSSPVAFLIVRTMLLTGFDAPQLQVLYLDRMIQDAELLQAIARVNRTASGKSAGYVVDYYGVGAHLQSALKAYAPEDAADSLGVLTSILDELPKLRDRRDRVVAIFAQAGIDQYESPEDLEACVEVLADEPLRARYSVLLKLFLTTLDTVLPRPEGLPFVPIAKRLCAIQKLARHRYRDDGLEGFDPSLYGEKVRALIDEHVLALDIATRIPPVSITDPEFFARLHGLSSDKAKASEMEHAARFHIRKNFDQDPGRYSKLSERLEEILVNLRGKWEQLSSALEVFVEEMKSGVGTSDIHADPLVVRFYGLLAAEFDSEEELTDVVHSPLLQLAERIVTKVLGRVRIVRFWSNPIAQDSLRNELILIVDDADLFPFELQPALADNLMELAEANRGLLSRRLQGGSAA